MRLLLIIAAILTAAPTHVLAQNANVKNTVVFQEPERFAGWPANNGIWSWGDEIVVGFTLGYYKKNPTGGHDIDRDQPSVPRQARSMDGGETWVVERPSYIDKNGNQNKPQKLDKPIDFSNPDLAVRFTKSQFHYSLDRCLTWNGPYELPVYGRPNLLCRTDYIVEGKNRLTAFIAAAKESGSEGQPLCIRTLDGGMTWDLVGWIGNQPPAAYGYAIMPATVRIGKSGYLSMIRRGGIFDGKKRWWIEPFVSPDDGKSWYLLKEPQIENSGNPATLTRLKNGKLAMTYGWRRAPYGIRGRISDDDGQTWSREFVLRDDAASWDIGYPRSIQRADGKMVTIYYYHNDEQPQRFIGCTIWDPEQFER